jgi:predicted MarR family transcription regulator
MESTNGLNPGHGHARQEGGELAPHAQDRHMSVDPLSASLTRMELSLMRLYEAFSSWALELQKYVSGYQLSFPETALLHCVRLRGGTTTLAEMMIFMHRHDLAAINYSLRRLEQHGVIRRVRGPYRREVAYALTDTGRAITDAYGRLRQQVLVQLCREVVGMQAATNDAAAAMERMTGIYDQATQAVLNQSLIATGSMLPPELEPEPAPAGATPKTPKASATKGATKRSPTPTRRR